MLQCSLTELIKLSEIVKSEKQLATSYVSLCEYCNDPQLREKLQKCAAIHNGNTTVLENLLNS